MREQLPISPPHGCRYGCFRNLRCLLRPTTRAHILNYSIHPSPPPPLDKLTLGVNSTGPFTPLPIHPETRNSRPVIDIYGTPS